MQCEIALVNVLKNDAGVAAIVGTRIYPDPAPQDAPRPLISYWRVSTQRIQSHDGAISIARPRIQVNSVGDTYLSAKTLANAVRTALDGYRGDGVHISFLDNDADERQLETSRHLVRQDYLVWSND